MITFERPEVLLLLIPLVTLTVLFWWHGYANLGPRRTRVALGVRLALLGAIVLGIAGMGLNLPQSRQATVFVADLSASDVRAQSAMQRAINQAAANRPADARLGVVTVGRDARVELPPSATSSFDGFQTRVNQDYSNLEDGLSLANAVLPDGYRRRIVMMTDGRQNIGDALATARLLHAIGVRVDVWPVDASSGPEVLVDSVTVPSELRPDERFSLEMAIRSTVNTSGTLVIYRDHTLVLSRKETIQTGENPYTFEQTPLRPGFHTFQVQIDPVIDTQPENNVGTAFTLVAGPPKVLVISPSAREAANVLASLQTTGIQADYQRPGDVVPTLSSLQRYGALVLVNTPIDALDPDLVNAVVPYVRDLGRGLVVIGGREAYGVGGYGQSGLEQALPVKMDIPKRKDLPTAAVVLIIESLESDAQVDISRQAGKGVVRLLTARDQIAVSGALENGSFAVPLQHVANTRAIDAAIDQMQPGDPPSYATDLQAAYEALKKTTARLKHIIILGDGDAEDTAYEQLAKRIRAGGVTISTIATNGLGLNDFQTMRSIARWGGGRYYRADNPAAIPAVILREARTVARSGFVEGRFYPQEISPNPMIRDIRTVPDLTGYVATTPKPAGELVLASKKLDPVLAGWQFGLGRAVAWTSDAAGLWTRDWLRAPGANRFWANLVSWTLPAARGAGSSDPSGHLFITTTTSQGQGRLSIDTPPALGANPSVTAAVLGPDRQTTTIQLQPAAPGHFSGSFLANTPGAYFVSADARGVDHSAAGQAGLDVPYSAEYRSTGTDIAFLRALAGAGGGSVLAHGDSAWQDNLAAVYARTSLQAWLWLLALLLLPIDVGVRRLVVTRGDLLAIWQAFGRAGASSAKGQGAEPGPIPVFAPLGRVRQERERRRSKAPRSATDLHPATRAAPPAPRPVRIPMPGSASAPLPAARSKPEVTAPSATATTTSQLLAAKRKRRT